jgi:hypothetical protein
MSIDEIAPLTSGQADRRHAHAARDLTGRPDRDTDPDTTPEEEPASLKEFLIRWKAVP